MLRPVSCRSAIILAFAIGTLSSLPTTATEARSYVEDAQSYLQKGDLKSALIQLRNAVREAPGDPKLREQLAALYLRVGDAVSAEREARAARERRGSEVDYLPILIEALLQQGKYADLLGQVQPGDRSAELESKVRLGTGIAEMALHRSDRAEDDLRESARLDPTAARPKIILARLVAAKDTKQAEELIDDVLSAHPQQADAIEVKGIVRQAQGDQTEAMRLFDEALKIDPRYRQARLSRIRLNIQQGNFGIANDDLELAEKDAPKDPSFNYLRAQLLTAQKKFSEADAILDRISSSFDLNWDGYYLQGMVKFERGQDGQAEAALSKFLGHVPDNADAARLAAIVALRRRAPATAVQYLKPIVEKTPDDAIALGLLGNAYMADGKPDLAIQQFGRAAAIDPNNPRTATNLALATIGSGKTKQGLAELEHLAETEQDLPVAGPALAVAELRSGQFDKAAAVAVKLVRLDQKNPVYQTLLGMARTGQDNTADAITALRQALTLEPDSGAAARNLGALLLTAGQPDNAAQVYQDFLNKKPGEAAVLLGMAEVASTRQQWEQMLDYLKQAKAASPDNPAPAIELTNFYLWRGDTDRAAATATELVAQFPSSADAFDAQARAQLAQSDNQGAVTSYKRAYQLAPASSLIMSRYVLVLMQAKRFADAKAVLQEAIERDPTNEGLKADLVRIIAELNGIDAGIEQARGLAAADPSTPRYDILIGELYEKSGRLDDARELLEKTAAGWSHDNRTAIALAGFYERTNDSGKAETLLEARFKAAPNDTQLEGALALLYQRENKFLQALPRYEHLVSEQPNDIGLLNNLAWLYQQNRDLEKARHIAERAAALAPQSAEVADTLGWILVAQGDTEQALTYLRTATSAAPREPTIQFHLAVALSRNGRSADAQNVLEKLLGTGAVFPDKAEAEKLLGQLKRG